MPWALAALVMSGWPASAAESSRDCSKPALRKARAAAAEAARRKDYKAAIAALSPLAAACDEADAVERGWLVSDLAVDYLKDGQLLECKKLIDQALFPKSDIASASNDKLSSALAHNGELCEEAFAAQYGPFSSAPCPLTVDDATKNEAGGVAAVALPQSLWPKGASAACLAVVAGAGKCPRVIVVVQRSDGKLNRRTLKAELSGLSDETFCCGYDTIAIGIKNATPMVRLGADTVVRECSGGTAHSTLDEVLAWRRDLLSLVVDASTLVGE
jgi:hypothetical protein